MTKKTKSMWRFEKERKRILFIISGAFFILFISLIANKLFNFPRLILNHLFPSLDNEWIYLITNLLLVTFAAVITIAIILHKQGEALKEIEVLPKVESELSHNFLNELPLFFIVINVDGTTRYINQLLLDALGYQEEEI
jgi:PAS domain-containing protein